MIPKIIHQTWKTNKFDYWIFKKSQASVSEHLAEWQYNFWTDADLDAFIRSNYNEFYNSWKLLNQPIKRVDLARYLILHKFGGVYADLDFIFTKSLDELIDSQHRIYLYVSQEAVVKEWQFLGNAFMMSAPGDQFWIDLVIYMLGLPPQTHVLHHTGPRAIGSYYASLETKPLIKVLSPDYIDNDRCEAGVGLHRFGYHMRAATWQHPEIEYV